MKPEYLIRQIAMNWWWAAAMGAAVTIGVLIAQERWALAGAVLAMILLLVWPFDIGLGLYAFMVPFDSIAVIGSASSGRTLTWVIGAATGIALLVNGIISNSIRSSRSALWWGGFILWGAVTAVWALDQDAALQRIPTAAGLFMLYAAAACTPVNKRQVQRVAIMSMAGGFLSAAYACYQFSQGSFYATSLRSSLAAGERETDPNVFAVSLLLPFSLVVGGFLSSKRAWVRWALLAVASVIGLALFLTMSRGAVFALSVMIVVWVLRMRLNWRVLIPVTLLATILIFVPNLFFARFQQLQTEGNPRFDIWKGGIVALKHYAVQGAGLNGFPSAYTEFASYAPRFRGLARDAHNIYLTVAVELGVAGLVLFFGSIVIQLRGAWSVYREFGSRLYPQFIAFEAACWGVMGAGVFVNVLWRKDFWLVWMMLALATRQQFDRGLHQRSSGNVSGL